MANIKHLYNMLFMRIRLSDHFNTSKLLKFALPSIAMMIITSLYSIVDGLFVSNFVGKTPFAALNLMMPLLIILATLGFMLGTGGSALISKTMGEGDSERAKRLFSMFIFCTLIIGIAISFFTYINIEKIAVMLGADGEMVPYCVLYGSILLVSLPFYMLQYEFQEFFITAEKPQLGLLVTVISGITNMVLDAIFIIGLDMDLAGAAWATAASEILGGIIPIIYFLCPNSSLLHITRPVLDLEALFKACTNGASEFMSTISVSLVNMLYNYQLMRYIGENGIAAYGVIMYINMVFMGVYFGYSSGMAPIVSYHFGAENKKEIKNLHNRSLRIIFMFSTIIFVAAELLSGFFSKVFVGYDAGLYNLTVRVFRIYSLMFIFAGFSIYGSSFFTALNDGLISGLISFLRGLVFQVGAILLLPILIGVNGIGFSSVFAEICSMIMTAIFLKAKRIEYGY